MDVCPKCGYVRQQTDTAPEWQCPNCGIAYAKYGTTPHVHAHNLNPITPVEQTETGTANFSHDVPTLNTRAGSMTQDAEENIISQYQEAKREFKPLWNLNWLIFAAPGFVLFAVGGETHSDAFVALGFSLFVVAMIRGLLLWRRYKRCPACNAVQGGRVRIPFRKCGSCGARLSHGWKDST